MLITDQCVKLQFYCKENGSSLKQYLKQQLKTLSVLNYFFKFPVRFRTIKLCVLKNGCVGDIFANSKKQY